MSFIRTLALIASLTLFSSSSESIANVLQLSSMQSELEMRPYLSFWEDKLGNTSIEVVVSEPGYFEPIENEFINADLTNSKFWLRFELENLDDKLGRWAIATGSVRLDHLSLYQLTDETLVRVYHSNHSSKGDEREISSPNIYIPIALRGNSRSTFFLAHQSQGTVNLNLDLLDTVSLQKRINKEFIFDFTLIGFFLALGAINLFHFLALRNKAHLYYSLLMLASVVNTLHMRNYTFIYLFPDSLETVRFLTPWISSAAVFLGVMFTRHFFDLKKLSKRLYTASNISVLLLLVPCITVVFAPFNTALSLMAITSPQAVVLMVMVGFFALYKQRPSAGYFAFAWVIYAMGLMYYGLSVRGFSIGGLSGIDAALIASAVEGLVLSMALAHQVRHIHQRDKQSQTRLIESLQQNNTIQRELVQAERAKFLALFESNKKSQKLAAASHDFSSPIQALRASLTTLKKNTPPDTAANSRIIEHISDTLGYLQSLSNTLIQEEKEEQLSELESFTASDLFVDVFNRYSPIAEQKGLEFYFVVSNANIQANRLAVTRILENYVSNALRYTDQGRVFFGLRRRPDSIEIQVFDTGPGIKKEAKSKLDKAFTQIGGAEEEGSGFGLGLSIAHTLCDEMQFEMRMASEFGKGSMFSFVIPICD